MNVGIYLYSKQNIIKIKKGSITEIPFCSIVIMFTLNTIAQTTGP